ncbi:MAG: sulfur carrier protein ThiS [Succinivibrio sp.]|nr:sulfur carrier protein ThiS [Succinivibrio sp.]
MKLTVAGESKDFKDGLTVAELLVEQKVDTPQFVTVSVNDNFVDKENFDSTVLKEGDVVEFMFFMGGGA